MYDDDPIITCNRCGHACHCEEVDCQECVNDVCTECNCDDFYENDSFIGC